jgi:hypothetical protein
MPSVNTEGFEFSFASITLLTPGGRKFGAVSINYDDGLDPGMSDGTSTMPTGWTAGKWSGNASIEFNRRDGQELLAELGNGYGRVSFQVQVQYAEDGTDVITDELPICRIKKVTNPNQAGTDPSKMNFELALLKPVIRDGLAIEVANDNTGTAA